MKWRFAGIFLLSFALLLVLWWAADVATLFRSVVLTIARAISPLVNGWWIDVKPNDAIFRSGSRKLHLLVQLPQLSMGMVPFLALVAATPGIGLKRATIAAAVGSALYVLIDVGVVLAYPFIIDQPNVFKDTLGVFSGLVAFVVAPLGLWFVMTYPELRALWQLVPPAPQPAKQQKEKQQKAKKR
jgi:hypothetical protein